MTSERSAKQRDRLDNALVARGLVDSRTKAQALILAGQVRVNGEIATKAGSAVPKDADLELVAGPKYASRGGEKLEGALDDFGVNPAGLVCLDVGASTGGFTDCLLQRDASRVYAVDVGRGQLAQKLRDDPRVISLEDTHILKLETLPERPALAVIDVSFISLKNILAKVRSLVDPGATVLPMVKPQFELGAKFLKKGVVRSEVDRERAVDEVEAAATSAGFECRGRTPARIKGPKGNQEFFLNLRVI
ncbi:MAG: TlyA family RNA methyltransferase [Elusimicrobia bacterium]|nr:TlyA family RNA methyltransferase [Elusimicrobiota bacterium]